MLQRLAVGALFLLVGCQGGSSGPTASGRASAEERLQRPRWEGVKLDVALRALVTPASRIVLDRAPVPVLMPKTFAPHAIVTADTHWAAWSSRHAAVTVSVHATDLAVEHEDVPAMHGTRTIRGVAGWITQNEGIWSASWQEHGAAYTLELECDEPTEARCANDELLLAIADELAVAGPLASDGTVSK